MRGESNVTPGENAKAGAVVTLTATVTNTGDVPLLLTESKKTLPVGGSLDFPQTVVLDEGHVRRGYVAVGGTFGASTPSGATYISPLYGYSFPLPSAEHPAVTTTTRGEFVLEPGEQVVAGTSVRWTVAVTNTGDVDLHRLNVDDDDDDQALASLPAGARAELHTETTVSESEFLDGSALLDTVVYGDSPAGRLFRATVSADLPIPKGVATSVTPTPAPTPTSTASPAPTADPTAAATPTATRTPSPTPAPTATSTAAPIPTATPTAVPIPTVAPATTPTPAPPTAAPTPTAVPTAPPTPTAAPIASPASTATPTAAPGPWTPLTEVPGIRGGTSSVGASAGTSATATATGGIGTGTGVAGSTPTGTGSTGSGASGPRAARDASATRLAETGVDASSALPAAGVLGLLGALGLLLGRRRRGNRAAG